MLMIDFFLRNSAWSAPAVAIVEVIPNVELAPLHNAPDYLVGVCNLRGRVLPVIDLTLWITGKKSRDRMHTRIMIVELEIQKRTELIGIRAEKIVAMSDREKKDFSFVKTGEREPFFVEGICAKEEKIRRLLSFDKFAQAVDPLLFLETGS